MSEPSLQGKDVLPAGRSLKRSLRGSIFKLQADVSSSAALIVNENTSSVLALSNFNHKHDGVGNFLVDCVKIYTLRHVANIVGKHANIGQCYHLAVLVYNPFWSFLLIKMQYGQKLCIDPFQI